MARKRTGLPLHGWLALDKPLGMTSSQAVGAVRRLSGAAKAGHGGTLDPLATGILPIALGEATKTVAWAMAGEKTYRMAVRWGEATTTDDAEGAVIETSGRRPSRDEIEAVLPRFTGRISQIPPIYSAIKVAGRRAYDLARADQAPELAPREIDIAEIRVEVIPDADHAVFLVRSGKGAYMRGIARDLAKALDTCGHVVALRRLAVGRFDEAVSISLEKLETLGHNLASSECLLAIETALDDIPALALEQAEALRLRHGQPVMPQNPSDRDLIGQLGTGATVLATSDGKLVAFARIDGGLLRPVRLLNH